jgi:hypothetical protein
VVEGAAAIANGAVGIELADKLPYKRLPFDEGSRVVRLETQDTAASRVEPRVLHDFAIWRRSLKTVAELGAARVSERNVLTGEGRIEALRVAEITASAFPLTRVPPLLGRPLQPTDEMQGAEPVVVLGYDVWQRQFLHDPAIIGRVVTVSRTARTVVGVMPPRFGFPRNHSSYECHSPSTMRCRRKGRPCRCSAGSLTERAGSRTVRWSAASRRRFTAVSDQADWSRRVAHRRFYGDASVDRPPPQSRRTISGPTHVARRIDCITARRGRSVDGCVSRGGSMERMDGFMAKKRPPCARPRR